MRIVVLVAPATRQPTRVRHGLEELPMCALGSSSATAQVLALARRAARLAPLPAAIAARVRTSSAARPPTTPPAKGTAFVSLAPVARALAPPASKAALLAPITFPAPMASASCRPWGTARRAAQTPSATRARISARSRPNACRTPTTDSRSGFTAPGSAPKTLPFSARSAQT